MKRLTVCTRLAAVALAMLVAFPLVALAAGRAGKAVEPFNGKDLTGWKTKGKKEGFWKVGTAKLDPANPKELVVEAGGSELVNAKGHGVDLYSEVTYGDAVITLEVMVPQGANSGIYLHGEYEIQVLDSFGKTNPGKGDMGGIYGAQAPKDPVYKKPGQWSTYEIHWQAPKFDAGGQKTANARFLKVILNGALIHENVEMPKQTPGGVDGKEKPRGPLMFQGNHGPVAFRNIRITPLN